MTHTIYANLTASVSELKKNPMGTVTNSYGEPLAILNRNEPVFYCIPAKTYEYIIEALEDLELKDIIKARSNEKEISVSLNDL
ncbi:MAG: type II toxin-antitoxin system Phd/YefM family antitoxin [Proteobacteria bacterium]|nr:type II toxin-antitoxin system Phd/YefM family antitoxin [Pseudomonadota bacterium]